MYYDHRVNENNHNISAGDVLGSANTRNGEESAALMEA